MKAHLHGRSPEAPQDGSLRHPAQPRLGSCSISVGWSFCPGRPPSRRTVAVFNHLYAVCRLLWRSSFNKEDDLILTQSGGILKPAPECRPAGEILVRRRQTLDGRRRETDGGPWTAGLELVAAPHGCAEKARALAGGQPGSRSLRGSGSLCEPLAWLGGRRTMGFRVCRRLRGK